MPENKKAPGVWPSALVGLACLALITLQLYPALTGGLVVSCAVAGAILAAAVLIGARARTVIVLRGAARAPAARAEEENQFRLLLDGVADHAFYMLDPNGHVTQWNASGERMKGYTGAQIVGQHFSRFFTETDQSAAVPQKALEAAARHGKFELEGWRVCKDGRRLYSSAVISALRDRSGQLIGFAKITCDITERIRQQEALQRAHAALAQTRAEHDRHAAPCRG